MTPTPLQTRRKTAVLAITFITATLLFGILAILVTQGVTYDFDKTVLLWIHSHSSAPLNSFFLFATDFGGVVAIITASLALLTFLIYKKRYYRALFVVAAIAGASAINFILKEVFDRARPDLWQWLITETQFSFPSGHAAASSALALCAVVLLWQSKWRKAAIIVATSYVVIIGLSRLYLGVHFPSDILGGWLLSLAWVSLITFVIYKYTQRKRKAVS